MNKTKRTKAKQQALLAFIKENYEYLPDTGQIRHKLTKRIMKGSTCHYCNYIRVSFRVNGERFTISYHCAVWVLRKGRWPVGTIDHINGNPKDNRIENLRECSMGENKMNMEHPWMPNPETGVPGVEKHGRKFRTKILGMLYAHSSPYEVFHCAMLFGKRYKKK